MTAVPALRPRPSARPRATPRPGGRRDRPLPTEGLR